MTETIPSPPRSSDSYWLTRFVILRWLGWVYAVGFFVASKANPATDRLSFLKKAGWLEHTNQVNP